MTTPLESNVVVAPTRPIRRRVTKILKRSALVLLCLMYVVVSTAGLALYGPFDNIRRTIIGAVLTSSHPWVIRPFFSAATLKKYSPVSIDKMSTGSMNVNDYSNIHNNQIEVIPIQSDKYTGCLLVIHDPKRVHVAVTQHLGNIGETVSQMVKDAHAIAGINGGGFFDGQGHGTGGEPMGLTFSRGKYIAGNKSGAQPVIGITRTGALIVGKYTYQELQKLGVQEAVSYGPELVRDGKPYLSSSDGSWGIAPRSAIGQRKDGSILLLALSGRGHGGIGASLMDCQDVMLEYGAEIAANLDGGYSSELYYNGQFLVAPSNPLGERYVATSFVVDGEGKA
ncbi:phosphodiester glycosidase family protein [Alicyclobacillus contaminans]|uniref:phosphodiester glycosidase family protein n=1 Tax=Alicyclobacillus contaminans TaxID=392016 RepID=UPI000686AA21|nr:phosphodiester glycosidase family protein [Alicyclobacillus contaminans]